ncbi:NAD(P)/FAD-dependent oxidoreductase [Pseudonocardia eucalypti]|uniref:NAD(P)/FAD-dependent oxidoreductase n=1 Tax=Pseudonocardia eucalypti TaxID=648755 RepID=A0ABP9PVX8_9PSEU|nr:cation diffusion facilitator CzcD-associated flavoprotein CzcO [Pseudonocardia eucalypti]
MAEEHVDVLIVGAGLSGIGAACHLRRQCPGKTFAILEARDAIGGTWDLFRYPGIRSDSDMYTLGYSFSPWTEPKAIADGDSIRDYVRDTAARYGVDQHIRFRHRVLGADWSSADATWTVRAEREDPDGNSEPVTFTCSFLFVNAGYYRYDQGYTPEFPGVADYTGTLIHPQHWPEDLDYAGKRVVVIGSGATAVTLVPAMAEKAAHVTMLQRSPTYIVSMPARDPLADLLRDRLPTRLAYPLLRWKNVGLMTLSYQLSRKFPGLMKAILRKGVKDALPAGYDVDAHFKPSYDPWDQRLCLIPDGDLFRTIRDGRADVVTDHIDTFTPTGLRLRSGRELEADIVITATGLNVQAMGGMNLTVDGEDLEPGKTVAYKGMMLSGVPNFALTIGYTNASWTLKADLVAEYVCRLLNHLDATGKRVVTPLPPPEGQPLRPLIDLQSGYVLRSVGSMPQQGAVAPWRLHQNYTRDVLLMRRGSIQDAGIRFSSPAPGAPAPAAPSGAAEPAPARR